MAEYIEREAVMKELDKYGCATGCIIGHHSGAVDIVADIVYNFPTADVAEVKHGKWISCFEDFRKQIEGDKCSNCGFKHYGSCINHYHYCPNCGAKMGDDEE